MDNILKVLVWPFKAFYRTISFILSLLKSGLGVMIFSVVAIGIPLGIAMVFTSLSRFIETGDLSMLVLGFLSILLSGGCLKLLNRIMGI